MLYRVQEARGRRLNAADQRIDHHQSSGDLKRNAHQTKC
jgi:hypothetical protein